MRFVPITTQDRADMLALTGVDSIDGLFSDIPAELRGSARLCKPGPMNEIDLAAHMEELASKDTGCSRLVSFMGGGCYDHFIPSIVDAVLSKPAFFTAYTPYQAEVSQGTLQAMYEYQSMMCMLTGMDVANASMYDGATACAEAALMAARITHRDQVVVSGALHPEWQATLATYSGSGAITLVTCSTEDGATDLASLHALVCDRTCAVICASPSWHGVLEDLAEASRIAHSAGALFVVATNPILLGVLEPPAVFGADIVVAEGQCLGNAQSFGGPGLGVFACRREHIRHMPGRVVGRTTDVDGRPGFVLTFSTREQHIRREKATSNICSNHALNALAAAVYLTVMGPDGLWNVGAACVAKAHYLADALVATGRFNYAYKASFAHEFVLRYEGNVPKMQALLREQGFLAGIDLGRFSPADDGLVLFSVTEKRTRAQLDRFVEAVAAL